METGTKREYWPTEQIGWEHGYDFELRTGLAWQLVRHFGSVAGTPTDVDGVGHEDRAGRSVMLLQSPEMLVARCYRIADEFVKTAESRGEVRGYDMSSEELFERSGQLQRIKSRAEYPIDETPRPTLTPEELEMKSRHAKERAELRDRQRQEMEKKS